MDVDGDVDSQLLQQFSSMATNDREVLISEFQTLLGYQLSESNCAFFLDMNNWNLQAAICSYFEYQQPAAAMTVPQMAFVKDITIGEGESIPPNTRFTKTWKIQNTGSERWPEGCFVKFIGGDQCGPMDCIAVEALEPGACTDVSVELTSPLQTGIHQGQWRMSTPSGLLFGEYIWMILQVDEGGVLAVTQLLTHFGSDLVRVRSDQPHQNPFSSPARDMENSSHQSADSRHADWGVGGAGGGASAGRVDVPTCFPRHSSLPSSPRHRDDEGGVFARVAGYHDESAHARSRLLKTPDNSPSKTISGSRSATQNCHHSATNCDVEM